MPYHLPQDALQAKFSLEFAIAGALVHDGVGFAELSDAVIRSAPIQRLMALVRVETTAEFEPEWRDAAPYDQVSFVLDDGRLIESPQVRRATGHADTPLGVDELRAKCLGCARHAGVPQAAAGALFDTMQRIEQLGSVAEIATITDRRDNA